MTWPVVLQKGIDPIFMYLRRISNAAMSSLLVSAKSPRETFGKGGGGADGKGGGGADGKGGEGQMVREGEGQMVRERTAKDQYCIPCMVYSVSLASG